MIKMKANPEVKERKRIANWYFFFWKVIVLSYGVFVCLFVYTLLPISVNGFTLTPLCNYQGPFTLQNLSSQLELDVFLNTKI